MTKLDIITREELIKMQLLSLDDKITLTLDKIIDFYEYFNGNVHVSFSGGKDSTVLLNLVRSIYPDVPAVYVNTGLEYPEINEFVNTISNIIKVRPEKNFTQVINDEGYPIVSKKVSKQIRMLQNPTSKNLMSRILYLEGVMSNGEKTKFYKLPKKWVSLIKAPFKVSDKCCDILKKKPLKKYQKETGRKCYVGTMASDSLFRKEGYLKTGCNSFDTGMSRPLSFWKEVDIWEYIRRFNIPYSKIYDMGEHNTGCIYCMFGVHLEDYPNRFQRMKKHHPKLYDYCINKLNLKQCLEYIGVGYE